jgi:hypothetical protein
LWKKITLRFVAGQEHIMKHTQQKRMCHVISAVQFDKSKRKTLRGFALIDKTQKRQRLKWTAQNC